MPTLVVGMLKAWRDDYSDRWQCVEERSDDGEGWPTSYPTYRYVWGPRYIDELIYRDQCNTGTGALVQRLYAMQDANYNVVALAEEDGDVVERFIYDAYGRATVLDPAFTADADNTSDYAWTHLYTGRQLDSETGLMDYRNRCYHTGLGRFVSRDPVGYAGSKWNLYEYVRARPTMSVDPSGEAIVVTPIVVPPGNVIDEEATQVWLKNVEDALKAICPCFDYSHRRADTEARRAYVIDAVVPNGQDLNAFSECVNKHSAGCTLVYDLLASDRELVVWRRSTKYNRNEYSKPGQKRRDKCLGFVRWDPEHPGARDPIPTLAHEFTHAWINELKPSEFPNFNDEIDPQKYGRTRWGECYAIRGENQVGLEMCADYKPRLNWSPTDKGIPLPGYDQPIFPKSPPYQDWYDARK